MILAACAEDLGTCPMGAPLEIKNEVDEFLNISEYQKSENGNMELLCALVMGWPDHEPPKASRQFDRRVHWISD
jgi:nitroreductase